MNKEILNKNAIFLSSPPKGILAADESTSTISKRFDQINLISNFENRRKYRELLFSTNDLEKYISGIIMYDETIRQEDSFGSNFVKLLKSKGIHSGIKVDTGAKKLIGTIDEKITEGLDSLNERMAEYAEMGATFSKWRAVISINENNPSDYCVNLNAHALARYARIAQHHNIVPIVEPEVLMDGNHSIEMCLIATKKTLDAVFKELIFQGVYLGGILLKPNMIISGINSQKKSNVDEVATQTINCLKESVPQEVPGIVFLSGGQSESLATQHLNIMNKQNELPWNLSFSYGRALQQPVILNWLGKKENIEKAQAALIKRSKLNSLATKADYNIEMESSVS